MSLFTLHESANILRIPRIIQALHDFKSTLFFFFFVINSVGICDIYLKLERDSEEKLCLLPIILTLCFPLVISFESQKPEFSHQLT